MRNLGRAGVREVLYICIHIFLMKIFESSRQCLRDKGEAKDLSSKSIDLYLPYLLVTKYACRYVRSHIQQKYGSIG